MRILIKSEITKNQEFKFLTETFDDTTEITRIDRYFTVGFVGVGRNKEMHFGLSAIRVDRIPTQEMIFDQLSENEIIELNKYNYGIVSLTEIDEEDYNVYLK